MALIGILIVILGFAFKFDTILVVIVAGLATGLASGRSEEHTSELQSQR